MPAEVVIVREKNTYRLLHGHLRLANLLKDEHAVWIDVRGAARVRVSRSAHGYVVEDGRDVLPLSGT